MKERAARACALRERPFVTRASPYDKTPSVAPVEYDNHPPALTWRAEAKNIPRRQTPVPSSTPPRGPHRNRVVGTHHIFIEGERYGFECSQTHGQTFPSRAAEVGDVRLAGEESKRALKALTETSLLVSRQIRNTLERRL